MKRRFFLGLLLAGAVVSLAAEGDRGLSTDILLSSRMDGSVQYLYPETSWRLNPAVLGGLDRAVLLPRFSFSTESKSDVYTRTTDDVGSKGGTWTRTEPFVNTFLGFSLCLPSNGQVFGVTGEGSYHAKRITYEYENYDAEGQDRTEKDPSNTTINLNASGTYARRAGGLNLGVRFGTGLQGSSAESGFETVRDASQNDGEEYFSSGGVQYSTSTLAPFGIAGMSMKIGGGTLGISGEVNALTRNSTRYIAVDTDGDYFGDKIVSEEEYVTTEETWGSGGDTVAGYYDVNNTYRTLKVHLNPSLTFPLSDSVSLVASGSWCLYGSEVETYYYREVEDARNLNETMTLYTPDSFRAVAGLGLKLPGNFDVRIGAGIDRFHWATKRERLNTDGESVLDPENPNGYTEVSWGTDPGDDDVLNYGSSAERTCNDLLGLAGVIWQPIRGVHLVGNASVSMVTNRTLYRVFDNVTGKVWEEETHSYTDVSEWNLTTLTALVLELSEGMTLSITNSYASASSNTRGDLLPQSGGKDTTVAVTDSSENKKFNMNTDISIGFTF